MATGQWPTLIDIASRTDSTGNIPVIAEMLSQCNDFYDDLAMVEASEMTGHEFVFRNSMPGGVWRSYNQGTPYSKSTTAKARVGLGMLADWSQIDRALAQHSGNAERFRYSEDVAFMEGMSQTIVQTYFYGNPVANPATFFGLSTFYNTLNTSTAQNAVNVLSGGGSGSSNASMWLIGHGPETIFGLFPRGSKAGLNHEDRGDTVPAYDNLGNPFMAYTSYFEQQAGLCPKDWRYGVRLANLDVTNAGLAGTNPYDLFVGMDNMVLLFPKLSRSTSGIDKTDAPDDPATGVRPVFYVNRTVKHWLHVQAMRNRNVLLQLEDYAGMPVEGYRNIPIKVVDQLLNSEATVS